MGHLGPLKPIAELFMPPSLMNSVTIIVCFYFTCAVVSKILTALGHLGPLKPSRTRLIRHNILTNQANQHDIMRYSPRCSFMLANRLSVVMCMVFEGCILLAVK